MPKFPLKFLGIPLFIIIFILCIFIIKISRPSHIILNSNQNKFKINFEIQKLHEKKFDKVFANLNLPYQLKEGYEFELDSTSAAKLEFSLPIKSKIYPTPWGNYFNGQINTNFISSKTRPEFNLPKSTHLAVFAIDLSEYFSKKFNINEKISTWTKENTNNGHFFAIWDDNKFLFAAKTNNVNFDNLKQNDFLNETNYKLEEVDDNKFYLIKFNDTQTQSEQTLVYFEKNSYLYIVSSLDVAKEIIALKDYDSLKVNSSGDPISFYLVLKNKNQNYDELTNFIFPNTTNIKSSLEKIQKLEFTLKQNRFSGLIIFK